MALFVGDGEAEPLTKSTHSSTPNAWMEWHLVGRGRNPVPPESSGPSVPSPFVHFSPYTLVI